MSFNQTKKDKLKVNVKNLNNVFTYLYPLSINLEHMNEVIEVPTFLMKSHYLNHGLWFEYLPMPSSHLYHVDKFINRRN